VQAVQAKAIRLLSISMTTRTPWMIIWFVMTVATTVLYLLPSAGPPGAFNFDKITHFIAFGAIGLSAWPGTQRRAAFLLFLVAGIILAIGLEWLQSFVPEREFATMDTVANLIGLGVGTAAGLYLDARVWRHGSFVTRHSPACRDPLPTRVSPMAPIRETTAGIAALVQRRKQWIALTLLRSIQPGKSTRRAEAFCYDRLCANKTARRCCLRLSPGPSRIRQKQRNASMISLSSKLRPIARSVVALGLLVFALMLGACGGPVAGNPASIEQANALSTRAAASEYRLQPGDELDIRFYYNPELNTSILVRPDGRISLPLANEVQAAGLTPSGLTQRLRSAYEQELRRPELTVIVRSFNSQKVFVGGEVASPGVIQALGPLSVLQSVTQAGGFKETARLSEVLVIRRDPSSPSEPIVIPVDISSVVDGSETNQDIPLMPFDVVFVPKSPIANVNKFVDQYIRQNIPFGFGLTYGF
jgi:polysaccharide biosynthesis/export protein